jgi:hypothetical protein
MPQILTAISRILDLPHLVDGIELSGGSLRLRIGRQAKEF